MSAELPTYRVFLTDEATVAGRGERVRVWFVRLRDGWVRAFEHPEAQVERVSSERRDDRCPPGTIWQRSVELELPVGTVLRSTVSSPREEDLTAVGYLTRGRHAKSRQVRETYHRLIGNYRIVTIERQT